MPIDSWFIHSGQVQRSTQTTDAYNNAKLTYANQGDPIPGRLVEKQQRIWSDERKESVVVSVYLWLTSPNADLLERDRLIVDSSTFTVTSRLIRNRRTGHHISMDLERIE